LIGLAIPVSTRCANTCTLVSAAFVPAVALRRERAFVASGGIEFQHAAVGAVLPAAAQRSVGGVVLPHELPAIHARHDSAVAPNTEAVGRAAIHPQVELGEIDLPEALRGVPKSSYGSAREAATSESLTSGLPVSSPPSADCAVAADVNRPCRECRRTSLWWSPKCGRFTSQYPYPAQPGLRERNLLLGEVKNSGAQLWRKSTFRIPPKVDRRTLGRLWDESGQLSGAPPLAP
jgi:hypothetical protein